MDKKYISRKKAWIFQAVCLGILVIGVYMLFCLSGDNRFYNVLRREGYASTGDFGYLFRSDMEKAIRYAKLAEVLETDGELDLNAEVIEIETPEGMLISIALQDAIDYGEEQGLFFDEEYHLVTGDGEIDWDRDVKPSEEVSGETTSEAIYNSEEQDVSGEKFLRNVDAAEFLVEAGISGKEYQVEYFNYYDGDIEHEIKDENKVLLKLLYQLAEYYELRTYLGIDESVTNFAYRFVYLNGEEELEVSGNRMDAGSINDIIDLGYYFWLNSERDHLTYTFDADMASKVYNSITEGGLLNGDAYEIVAGVDIDFPHEDQYTEGLVSYRQFQWKVYGAFAVFGIAVFGLLFVLIILIRTSKSIHYDLDRWYTEAAVIVLVISAVILIWAVYGVFGSFGDHDAPALWAGLFFGCLMYFLVVMGICSLIRRRAEREIFRRSLIIWAARELMMGYRSVIRGRFSLFWVILAYLVGNVVFAGGLVLALEDYRMAGAIETVNQFLLFVCGAGLVLLNGAVFVYVAKRASHERRIMEALVQISDGAIDTKIDTKGMRGQDKCMAEAVNTISDGLIKVVEEQTRSERMKTDLIANVSHDLRTPLTSIINYVDLIKRENIQNIRVQEYLDVLERKSQRMKNLTEDLMDASKVSSGNMAVDWERIDMVQMVSQMEGEFQEKFEASGLTPVTDLMSPPVFIQADGRLLSRVLENLYNNVCKYAMKGTRVYIDLKETSHKAIFTMKNISADPLNISVNELTERFVRGDVSRTTEGSGLGLSIAQSITELLKGTFEIYLEGDLFRVRLIFPLDEADRP